MSVDGIGKGGPGSVAGGSPLGEAGAAQAVSDAGATEATAEASATRGVGGSDALQQLQAGEITLDAYVEQQVVKATEHLKQAMLPQQLEIVTERLRLELKSDPALLQLVKLATGHSEA